MTTSTGPRVSRLASFLMSLLLAVGVLVVLGQTDSAEAAARGLRTSKPVIVAGEKSPIAGKLPKGKRKIVLQARVGKRWKAVATRSTAKSGRFKFVVKPRKTTVYRAYAPKAGTKRPVKTRAIRISVVKPGVSAYTLPGLADYGNSPRSSSSAQGLVTSRFVPARPGRTVVLQRKSGSRWSTIGTAKQNSLGNAAFKVGSIPSGSLRVVALASGGAPAVAGSVVKKSWSTDYVTEFSGSTIPSEWRYRLQDQYPGGLRSCARSTSDMVDVSGGVVKISSARDAITQKSGCPNGTYRNGHIGTTYDTYKFGYGIAAARVKFQEGGGQHSAFWLQSQSGNLGSEIDVAEYFGKNRSDFGLTQFVHYKNSSGQGQTSGSITDRAYQIRTRQALANPSDDWWKAYHVFSVEWLPNAYIFRIDGVETFRTAKGLTNREAVLILSSLTSDYEIPRFGGSLAQNTTTVDWVRTWKSN